MSDPIPRKVLVCAQKRCQRCPASSRTVPDDCPWAILHPLETRTGGTQERERQTGKTTELVEMANILDGAGFLVYYLTETENMADCVRTRYPLNKAVKLMSWRQANAHMRGMAPGIVLADELTANEMAQVKRDILNGSGNLLLAHYYTPV